MCDRIFVQLQALMFYLIFTVKVASDDTNHDLCVTDVCANAGQSIYFLTLFSIYKLLPVQLRKSKTG